MSKNLPRKLEHDDKVEYIGEATETIERGAIFSVRWQRSDGWVKVVRIRPGSDRLLQYAIIRRALLTLVKKRKKLTQKPFDWSKEHAT